ncbi:PadR family transcriptional regulator [Falsirhodobacter deserti]|uniref:PadR family transcriptional regulator n=1 Tax=Falsirhodobacter deserti TaxID=1365611 RepID=UPI000FE3899E|nr:PadR family transcriptional regulator [Falsirhodobacter deserti]
MNPEMLKGHLDAVLLSVVEGGAGYGYAIIKEISQRSQGALDLPEGTIYPALHRLEKAGLIVSQWEQAPSGRKRRTYTLTDLGRRTLTERCDQWNSFANVITALLTKPRAATAL